MLYESGRQSQRHILLWGFYHPGPAPPQHSLLHMQVMEVQRALLELLRREYPDTMYPAALCALADLKEVKSPTCCCFKRRRMRSCSWWCTVCHLMCLP